MSLLKTFFISLVIDFYNNDLLMVMAFPGASTFNIILSHLYSSLEDGQGILFFSECTSILWETMYKNENLLRYLAVQLLRKKDEI